MNFLNNTWLQLEVLSTSGAPLLSLITFNLASKHEIAVLQKYTECFNIGTMSTLGHQFNDSVVNLIKYSNAAVSGVFFSMLAEDISQFLAKWQVYVCKTNQKMAGYSYKQLCRINKLLKLTVGYFFYRDQKIHLKLFVR